MTEAGGPARRARAARPGRRAGDSGTREAILEATRAQFAAHGYQGATIRAIAAEAGVDPALVHHFYGTKEELFVASMRIPVVPSEVIKAAIGSAPAGTSMGSLLVRTALSLWESTELIDRFTGLLKSAITSEQAAAMLREYVTESILGTIARMTGLTERWGEREAEFRIGLVASQMLGLAMTRLLLRLPNVTAPTVDELAAAIGPTIDRYLSGEICRSGSAS